MKCVKPVESPQGKGTEQQARCRDSDEDDLFWTTDTVQRRTTPDRSLKQSFLMGLERLHDQADFEPDDPRSPGQGKLKARSRRKAIIHVKPVQTGSVRRWVISMFIPSFNRSENDLVRSLCCYELLTDDTDDDGQGDGMRLLFSRTVDQSPRPRVP